MKNPSIASNSKVNDGQVETCVTLVTDATRKATGVAIRKLAKNGVLNKQNIERVRARGNEIVAAITVLVMEKFVELAGNINGIVKLISGAETLELDPTDGTETIAQASNVFTGGLDSDYTNWGLNVKDKPTGKLKVQVHEMIKNGTFAQIFYGMSDDLDSLCLTQAQITQFVKEPSWTRKRRNWLHPNYWTFFLFKVNGEFFVSAMLVIDGKLRVLVFRFSHDDVWRADSRRRVVVPQLAPAIT